MQMLSKLKLDNIGNVKKIGLGNIVVMTSAALGLVNTYLMMLFFEISAESDSYLLATAIMFTVFLVATMPFEQYVYKYYEYKSEGKLVSYISFQHSLAIVIGVISSLIFLMLSDVISSFYTSNQSLLKKVVDLSNMLALGMIFYPLCLTFEKQLAAQGSIVSSLLAEMTPNLMTAMGFIHCYIFNKFDVEIVVIYRSSSYLIECLIFGFLIRHLKFNVSISDFISMIRNVSLNGCAVKGIKSFPMIAIEIFISNFLTALGDGFMSIYYYGNRFAVVVKTVVFGASLRMFNNDISQVITSKKWSGIAKKIFNYLRSMAPLYFLCAAMVYLILPFVIQAFTGNDTASATEIKYVFFVLSVAQIFIIFENCLSFTLFSIGKNMSMTTIYTLSLAAFFFSMELVSKFLDFYFSIGTSMAVYYISVGVMGAIVLRNTVMSSNV
ncbi:hypothetical protein RIX33_001509 [Vibrio vulnificus]|nr:hypothetical protein [Vibrio vulnificus]